MAKINVYLPDDLHREWLARRGEASLSPICQRALREVLSGERENPRRDDPLERIEAKLDEVTRRLDAMSEAARWA